MQLVDIGINLAHDSYDSDRGEVIARARAAGVTRMVVTGSSVAGSQAALALAHAHPGILVATAGVHPHHALDWRADSAPALRDLLADPAIRAVGECGLDYFRNYSPAAAQRAAFIAQLELAVECGKPVFLHQRDAHADFRAIIAEYRPRLGAAVAHCFTGNASELEQYLALGLAIGITGWICDERRGLELARLVPRIPEGRLMLETDGPYLLPRDLVPKPASRRNEPAYLPHIARTVARLRGEDPAHTAAHTTAAASDFFKLPAVSSA